MGKEVACATALQESCAPTNSGMLDTPMIELQDLRKSFGGKPALHGLSLQVRKGEVFGLLGHNGAGKSTTLGILLGQVFPDLGEAFVGGVSVQQQRAQALARTGAIFEAPRFYE